MHSCINIFKVAVLFQLKVICKFLKILYFVKNFSRQHGGKFQEHSWGRGWEDTTDVVIFKLTQKRKKKWMLQAKSMKTPGAKNYFCSFDIGAQTHMVTRILVAVLGSTLVPKTPICRRHREVCSCPETTISTIYKWKIKMCRCQVTYAPPCRELSLGWQSQKLELDLLSHYISHRLSFLYPGANSPSTCYSDQKNVRTFHSLYSSEMTPQRNYSPQRQWQPLLNNSSSFTLRKDIRLPCIT